MDKSKEKVYSDLYVRSGNKEVEMNFYTINGLDREIKIERMCSILRRVCLEDEWVVQHLHRTGNP